MNTGKLVGFVVGMAATCVFAHEWTGDGPDYVFGTPETPLETGELLAPANAEVRSLTIAPASDATVTVSGGPLALLSGAVVSNVCGGTVAIAASATGTDGVDFARQQEERLTFDGLVLPKGVAKTIADPFDLSDYELVAGVSFGRDIDVHTMLPYNVRRTGDAYDVNLVYSDLNWAKCVKVRLQQSGSALTATVIYARYADAVCGPRNDFDVNYEKDLSVATSASESAYGVQALVFSPRERRNSGAFALTGALVPNGPVRVEEGVSLAIRNEASVWTAGRVSADYVVDGNLSFENLTEAENLSVGGTFAGAGGTVTFGPWEESVPWGSVSSDPDKPFKPGTEEWKVAQTFPTALRVADIVGFSDIMMGAHPGAAYFVTLSPDRKKMTAQFQAFCTQQHGSDAGYVKAVVMSFEDVEGGIQVKRASSYNYYLWSNPEAMGTDLTVTYSGNNGTYSVNSFTLQGRTGPVRVALSATNTMTDGSLVVESNACVQAQSAAVLPSAGNGSVLVRNGAELEIPGFKLNKDVAEITVQTGGVLRVTKAEAVFNDMSTALTLDGGTLDLCADSSTDRPDDAQTYLYRFRVRNGAHITGAKPRVAYGASGSRTCWTFDGAAPSYFESGALLVGVSNSSTFELNVSDVTGDAGIDLYQTGDIRDFGSISQTASTQYGKLRKSGDGTWLLDAVCAKLFGEVFVDRGVLLLGRDDVFPDIGKYAAPAFSLNGGTLAGVAGTANAIKELALTDDSTVDVSTGASIAFGDSSALEWTAGKRLTLVGLEQGTVRFGTSATALTEAQIGAIRVEQGGKTHRAILDEQGYVQPCDSGMMILLR